MEHLPTVVTFSGYNAQEIKDKILDYAKVFGLITTDQPELPLTAAPPVDEPATVTEISAKKRGRKHKAEAEKEAPAPTSVPATPTEPTPPAAPMPAAATVKKEDLRNMLQEVATKCGIPTAQSLLGDYAVSRLSDLEEKHYSALHAACLEAIKKAG